jgi:hypothetical protein
MTDDAGLDAPRMSSSSTSTGVGRRKGTILHDAIPKDRLERCIVT